MKKLLFTFIFIPFFAQGQTITTIAGIGLSGYTGDGSAATVAQIGLPTGIAYRQGSFYFADAGNNYIRKIDAAGIIHTIAGNGTTGYSGDGGAATLAAVNGPEGVAIDASGNIYVADDLNDVIRKIDTAGIIYTVAGNHLTGYSGDGGAATATMLNSPFDVTIDSVGNLYFTDQGNYRIRKVTPTGTISTVVGTGVAGYSGDGGQATAAAIGYTDGILFDNSGNLVFADRGNNVVRKVNALGVISTIAGNGTMGYSGNGGQATAAQLNFPVGLKIDKAGNLYIADQQNYVIRMVDTFGVITTIAGTSVYGFSGDSGPATAAQMSRPVFFALDACENLFFSDIDNNRLRKIATHPGCSVFTLNSEAIWAPAGGGSVSVYPIPATTDIQVRGTEKITLITISDLQGRIINNRSGDADIVKVDISNLPPGMYFAKINGTQVLRFVKE